MANSNNMNMYTNLANLQQQQQQQPFAGLASQASMDNSKKSKRRENIERGPGAPLPYGYVPTPFDICSGRGKKNWNLEGNVAFRSYIQTKVAEYIDARTKVEKTKVVVTILSSLRQQGFQFLKEGKDKRYYDIGDKEARDKVGHSLRDQVTALKQKSQKSQQQELHEVVGGEMHQRRPSLTLSDSGNETEMRRSALESTTLFKAFARRPSWIVGEENGNWECVDEYMDMDIDSDSATQASAASEHHATPGKQPAADAAGEIETSGHGHHQLMKNSILSFDERMSLLNNSGSNPRASTVSNPRMSIFNLHGSNGLRRSTLSGRSSLRMETAAELMRLSDVSIASDFFEDVIDWGGGSNNSGSGSGLPA